MNIDRVISELRENGRSKVSLSAFGSFYLRLAFYKKDLIGKSADEISAFDGVLIVGVITLLFFTENYFKLADKNVDRLVSLVGVHFNDYIITQSARKNSFELVK